MAVHQRWRRVQVLFPIDSYKVLETLAASTQRTISALVRETIEEQLIQAQRAQEKEQALARLCRGDTPVEDWEAMERDMEKRWEQCGPDDPER
jgi:predicted DNA-binding protein